MTVHARSRSRMWTAFTTGDGQSILNIADRNTGRPVSIPITDRDVAVFRADHGPSVDALVEALLSGGESIDPALPTPLAGSSESRQAA